MNQMIKVEVNQNNEQVVSGRELHEFLEVKTQYKDWFPRMMEYSFVEGQDFCSIMSESTGGRPSMDHVIKLDMAKEIAMIQRNEKGKQARKYFIEIEKQWNSPEQILVRASKIAEQKMIEYHQKVIELGSKILMLTHSNKHYTSTEIAKELNFRSATVLNNNLCDMKIQYKVNNTWVLTAKYSEKSYVSIKQNVLDNGKVVYDRKWTETGRQFLIDLFKEKAREIG